jgi:copper chaperone CopZ
MSDAWEHGFGEILFSLRKWLLVGIFLGGLLTWLLPQGLFDGWLSHPVLSYGAMLLASGPLYVCATGSIPIAASLVAKGLSPGAALVFLAVGPATNTATLAFVGSALGRKALVAYLGVMVTTAIGAGVVVDWLGAAGDIPHIQALCHTHLSWWENASAALLLVLMFRDFRLPSFRKPSSQELSMKFSIPSISCGNCARHVTKALESVPGVLEVSVDVPSKVAIVTGTAEPLALVAALAAAEYPGTLIQG